MKKHKFWLDSEVWRAGLQPEGGLTPQNFHKLMYLLGAATSYIISPPPKISVGCGPVREYGTMQNLNSKGLRDTYSGWTVSARMQRNMHALPISHNIWGLLPTSWRPFGAYFRKNITFMQRYCNQWLKFWGMIVHRLQFKSYKVLIY